MEKSELNVSLNYLLLFQWELVSDIFELSTFDAVAVVEPPDSPDNGFESIFDGTDYEEMIWDDNKP